MAKTYTYYTIYETTNKVNGKIYIGMHRTNNLYDDYLGSGILLHNAIRKYGIENFEKKILYIFDNYQEMKNKEKEIVTEEFVARKDNYNIAPGGTGGALRKGAVLTEETKKKISKSVIVASRDPELKKRRSESRKSWTFTSEQRAAMSKDRSGKIWIHSPSSKECKHIHPHKAVKFLENGWTKGRPNNYANQIRIEIKSKKDAFLVDNSICFFNIGYAAEHLKTSKWFVKNMIKEGRVKKISRIN